MDIMDMSIISISIIIIIITLHCGKRMSIVVNTGVK